MKVDFSKDIELFDSHLHIIDSRFPLVPNNGYLPEKFTPEDYLKRVSRYKIAGGAIISGSFQAFDQRYLIAALQKLGPSYVGVTQLPYDTPDDQIIKLDSFGVRAVRFNLFRGGSEGIGYLASMASRVYELVGWHIELYVDSRELEQLSATLKRLPAVSIDHLGMNKEGLPYVLELAESGCKIKASGFGRIDFAPSQVIKSLYQANPDSLMFGTDLPSTRTPKAFQDSDVSIVLEALGDEAAKKVFKENAIAFYKPAIS
jgi:predicted TIM-barrel fold metal-dependent hydrolase